MINKVILIGNVGADPEVRALEGGVKVARLRIATTERIYNRQTQETKEHTEWHNVTLWRNLADVADRFIRKGSQVYIEGSLRTRDWTDKDGNKRYATEIVANDLKMLGRRGDAQLLRRILWRRSAIFAVLPFRRYCRIGSAGSGRSAVLTPVC